MRIYKVVIHERNSEASPFDSFRVIADDFDSVIEKAKKFIKRRYEGTPVRISKIEEEGRVDVE